MTCDKCHGSGLIPFVKNGRTVSHAWIDCECKQPEPERYHKVTADIDYACSDTFRGYSYQYCGQPDPGYMPLEPEPEAPAPQVIEHRHSDMSRKDYASSRALEGEVKYLRGKLAEREQKHTAYKDVAT